MSFNIQAEACRVWKGPIGIPTFSLGMTQSNSVVNLLECPIWELCQGP